MWLSFVLFLFLNVYIVFTLSHDCVDTTKTKEDTAERQCLFHSYRGRSWRLALRNLASLRLNVLVNLFWQIYEHTFSNTQIHTPLYLLNE